MQKKMGLQAIHWLLIGELAVFAIGLLLGFKITYAPHWENDWNAIAAVASWASVFVSGLAIYYAIQVPKKIAEGQNKIALFEKRYETFQLFERCISFNKSLQNSETVEEMRKDCMMFFDELKFEELDFKTVMKKAYTFEHTLHQMEFLFPGVLEKDVHELYFSLWRVLLAIIGDDNINECKRDYINAVNAFASKYRKRIWDELTLLSK